MSAEPESFLARWSRRKRAAEREAERPAESAAPEAPAALPAAGESGGLAAGGPAEAPVPERDAAAAAEANDVPLPPVESLDGLRSDYQAFFAQPVSDELRRAALKKLFADPHFNQMDMLDVYVDDYTQFEPLPTAQRMRLPSARAFLLDSERAALEAAEAPTGAAGDVPEGSMATADGEGGPAAGSEAGGEASGGVAADASAEPTSALTAAPGEVGAPARSADDPARPADVSSSPADLPGAASATDPTST